MIATLHSLQEDEIPFPPAHYKVGTGQTQGAEEFEVSGELSDLV